MSLFDFYQDRIQRFTLEEAACARQNDRYAWLRLAIIIAIIVLGIWFYDISLWLSISTVIILLVAFAVCLKKHLLSIERKYQKERFKKINQQEAAALQGDHSAYTPGDQYINPKHYYTSDLDIFGTHSLFRYLNRTTSPSGSDMLAQWLSAPAITTEIEQRQEAVKELAPMIDWRQRMQAVGLKYKHTGKELPEFIQWLQSTATLSNTHWLFRVMRVLPWITVMVIIAASVGWIPTGIVWLLIAVHFIINGSVFRKINLLHQQISRKVNFVSSYSELINLIEHNEFSSPYMIRLRNCFTESQATEQIKILLSKIKKLDYRMNMYYLPVNILFFFDYKILVWLEHWRTNNSQKLLQWFDTIAKIEALSSFANVQFNHPDWVMPEIKDQYFILETTNVAHPLIVEKERVSNDFSLNGQGKIAIVTGSNMSGKSTFQRSIGINMVLALAGSSVCASSFIVSNCQLYTYMRIADNLEERTSSFYAELKRLKQLIDITGTGQQIFFLLDEILRGTNSRDRQIGSIALTKQLARQHVSGIIATHDLAMGTLEQELPEQLSNYHFDVQINGENMSFDYKLHTGICTSLNASILMRKIGIEVEN